VYEILTRLGIAFLALLALAGGCSSLESKPNEIEWKFGEKKVFLDIFVDTNLNLYENRPHTALVGVYQMENPNSFAQMAGTLEGLQTLLRKGKAEDASILSFEKLIAFPGRRLSVTIDRMEKAQYVGRVVG